MSGYGYPQPSPGNYQQANQYPSPAPTPQPQHHQSYQQPQQQQQQYTPEPVYSPQPYVTHHQPQLHPDTSYDNRPSFDTTHSYDDRNNSYDHLDPYQNNQQYNNAPPPLQHQTSSYYSASDSGAIKEMNVGDAMHPPSLYGQGYPPPNSAYGFSGQQQPYGYQQPQVPYMVDHRGYMHDPRSWNGGGAGWVETRDRMLKQRSVQQVQLQQGNLVLEIPVSSHIVPPKGQNAGGVKGEESETTKLRYSAATCDPDDFKKKNFTLRPAMFGRKTEMFIVMTMYNEDEVLFLRTLNSCLKNIANLCSRPNSKMWGPDGWKKVVVCIVQDGRKSVNPRTLKVLQLMGVYSDGVMKDSVGGKAVEGHIFEYTSQVIVSESGECGFGSVPVQLLFCLKEKNAKKLNSHRWFFNAFGPVLNPNVCILLDVGTKPTGTSLYDLYKVFDKSPNVGGACGEICVDLGKYGSKLFNPIVASQNFEYKMSNILDKPFESSFGLIAVLPGAFSAYRYRAVQNHPNGSGPLASYFLGEAMHHPGNNASISQRNMYLAEDRILAFEIVCKKGAKWTLRYIRSAKAYTDAPEDIATFISQRRRWLNGSLCASVHSTTHFFRIWTSGHGFLRKIMLSFLTLYNLIQLLFQWISLSSFYLAFYFLGLSTTSGGKDAFWGYGADLFSIFNKVYLCVIMVILVLALGNRPQGSKWLYLLVIIIFALCQILLLWTAGYAVYETVPKTTAGWSDPVALWKNVTFRDLALSLIGTYGIYLISSIMYLSPWHMITCFAQYLLLMPSYVNVLLIYSLCNLQDVTWGNRPEVSSKDLGAAKKVEDGKVEVAVPTKKEDLDNLWIQARAELRVPEKEVHQKRSPDLKKSDADRNFRTRVILFFLGTNAALILLFTSDLFTNWLSKEFNVVSSTSFNPYLTCIFWSVLVLSGIRFLGSCTYLLFRMFGH